MLAITVASIHLQNHLFYMPGSKELRRRIGGSFVLLLMTFAIQAQTANEASVKDRIRNVSGRIGLSANDIIESVITRTFTDKTSGIEYVYLQQVYKGIPVYNRMKTLAFKNGALVYSSGSFIQKEEKAFADVTPRVEAASALLKAAQHLHLPIANKVISFIKEDSSLRGKKLFFSAKGIAKKDISVQLYWANDSTGKWHLAWNVNIDVADSPDWWNVRINAKDGAVINKDNWTTYEQSSIAEGDNRTALSNYDAPEEYLAPPNDANSASYYVIPFPAENVNVKPFAQVANPWLMAGANNPATTYGWHYNGTATYNITRGNNVYAYDDSANKNVAGSVATSLTPLPNLSFSFTPDFNQTTSLSVNKSAAITNLFYWNNLMHDVMYQYGFTEAAGNFQQDNLGRGGTGADPVNAEAHDGSGLNNANFSTPDDGSSGRMQMYLWDAVKPPSFVVNTPSSLAGNYNSLESGFSKNNKLIRVGPISDTVALYNTDTLGCSIALPSNVKGKIALMYRGTCNFTDKVLRAQKAGAVAVIMVNTAGDDLLTMGGTNDSITIPAVMISYTDGIAISNSIKASSIVTVTLTGAPFLDGDFDNSIICHEYGHGITHRLTGGNASCMSNAERPDEGWSDYFGLMMTQNWASTQLSDSAKSHSFGTYVVGQAPGGSGIRIHPYSTNLTVDPHTYSDLASDGEVHDIGETWCSALWDMTWAIIKQEGSINPNIYDAAGSGGNVMALKLVIEGEKLQPCSPGFLDARDAILAADSILYNNRHKCLIWNAFARRGMGFSAVQGSSDKTDDQKAAFDVPVLRLHTETLPAINDQFTTKITVSCECSLPPNGYQLRDTIPAGFTVGNTSPTATVQGNSVSWEMSNFTALGQSNEYSVTLIPDATAGCAKDTVLYDDRDAHTGSSFTSSIARGSQGWTVNTAQSFSPTHSWHAADPETASDISLTSGTFTPVGFSVLSFYHHFITEAGYDGGLVEISTNGGTSWSNAAPYFFSNGPNGTIYSFNPSDTSYGSTPMPAFTGVLKDSGFIRSLVDLSSFSGKSIKVRFRMYTDLGTTYDGWYVDDITLTNACGGVQQIRLYNNAGKKIGLGSVANFNIDSNGVVQPQFADFSAIAVNNIASLLNWTMISETGVTNFIVEHSTDSLSFTTLTTVAAGGVGVAYPFTDNNPASGANFYRIRAVNSSGATVATSAIRKVTITRTGVITLVPNPANSRTTVLIDGSFNAKALAVFDMGGKRVLTATLSNGTTSYPINTAALQTGVYVVKIVSAMGEEKRVKLLVQR